MSLDLYNLGDNSEKVQIFTTSGMWHKPKGISMVYIHAVGGGGGGNGGASGATLTTRTGGGGGGAGNNSKVCIPAILISDSLVISVGAGGAGGAANGGLGVAGGQTTVIAVRGTLNINSTQFLVASGAFASAAAGTAGSGSGANSTFSTPLSLPGMITLYSSPSGGNGGSGAAGSNVTWGPGSGIVYLTTGGAGGGGVSNVDTAFSGGTVTGTVVVPSSIGGANDGSEGIAGANSWSPLYHMGGAGGGGNASGAGGKGGDGAPGCGGGGGGAGLTSGGAGGKGGDGYVVIVCW